MTIRSTIHDPRATNYDLAIIGSGFSGLAAACKAVEQKLIFCHISNGRGMSQHFSGAFDVIDPRWCHPQLAPRDYPAIKVALDDFIRSHPQHPYAQISKNYPDFSSLFLEEMTRFFSFYNVPVVGDFQDMVVTFGSTGMAKPTGCALRSQGMLTSQLRGSRKALYIDFPGLVDYHTPSILRQLKNYFSDVSCVTFGSQELFDGFDVSSYLKYFDLRDNARVLKHFIKQQLGDATTVLLPPILGLGLHDDMYEDITCNLEINLVELLSALPSVSGFRFARILETFYQKQLFPYYLGTMTQRVEEGHYVKGCIIQQADGAFKEIQAHVTILATGSSYKNDHIASHIQEMPMESQDFMRQGFSVSYQRGNKGEGHGTIKDYNNLRACGTAVAGFDFTRERCGFGVGLATALACFE